MSVTPETRPSRSSRRVEAWIYTVMNPLIDAMRSEAHLLERSNLSWRYYSRHAEYIRTVNRCIEPHNFPNLEDFLADNPQFDQKFKRHDEALHTAEDKAAAFFDAVISAPVFINQVNDALQQYDSMLNTSQPYGPAAGSLRLNLSSYIAEYLVNNIDSLPSTYETHRFWQLFGQSFQEHKNGPSFRALQGAIEELRQASLDLQHDLENQRLHLCREFDVPAAAPVVPTQFPTFAPDR